MKTRLRHAARIAVLPIFALLAACSGHKHHGGLPPVGTYAVADALAVGNGLQPKPGSFATAYYAPQPAGSPAPAASLAGAGQVAYAPDGSLYRYTNGSGGCAIAKYAFGAIGSAVPLATATGDANLTGTALPLGCYAAATDPSGNLYVLVANGSYLGIDVFDAQLVFAGQLGNGTTSGIFASGRIPSMPIAIDSNLNLYVGQGTTLAIFATSDRGDVAPAASFTLATPSVSLLFDASNDLYVGAKSTVSFFAPGSTTASSVLNLPTNTIVPSQSLQISFSNSLGLDSLNNLYVLTVGGSVQTSQVLRYGANSVGNASPVANIPVDANAQSIAVAPKVP